MTKPYPKLLNNYGLARKMGRIEEYIANERKHKSWTEYAKDVSNTLDQALLP
eukprot:CAMPEP_0197052124 /NCGR_PEP_ID=MMETSP1384-20130603/26660_1 /TAXON_ID=29189 /ORGANISM="Ammonia sp." /LENGTH=51 /DNA_ID=CAMNT_0042484781 /DNA_START=3 /DNA_END=158 /DNA_ORIENTATION=-